VSTEVTTVPKASEVSDLDGLRLVLQQLRETYDRDPEAGHCIEDTLKNRVLRLAADGHPDAARFAAVVLEPLDWDVERWYA
jgi:hypothetical protein